MERFSPAQAAEVRHLIKAGDFSGHRPPSPVYGRDGRDYFHETDEDDLQECFTTPLPVFSFCAGAELLELRLRMAVALVTGGPFALVRDAALPWRHRMTPKAAVHNFFASIAHHRNVSEWRKSNVVLRAKIRSSCDGPCAGCAKAAVMEYDLADLPSIPIPTCRNLNTVGCRCVAVASKIRGIDL